jgi:hypothetical protein
MSHPLHQDCQKVSQILARIGEKWSMLVVMLLRDGPRRFNDIKRNTAGISQQMLTRTLRGLERDADDPPDQPAAGRIQPNRTGAFDVGAGIGVRAMGQGPSRRIRGRPRPVRPA